MERVKRDIVVQAPLEKVYNQWTQFEEFPRFMQSVTEVRQLDDRRLLWRARILGRDVEWEADIEQQIPDERIRWHATRGRQNAGTVSFEPWEMGETKVSLEMEYELDGLAENIADAVGMIGSEVEGDLERFKEFIEEQPAETGAWRGEIASRHQPDERAIAEERQREPAPGSYPGGTPIPDDEGVQGPKDMFT